MRRFGELEAVIMDRLWDWGRPALVREVVDALHDERGPAYTTVMTVMENLYRKGWLRRERDGRAWRYAPAGARASYTRRADERRAGHQPGPAHGARAFRAPDEPARRGAAARGARAGARRAPGRRAPVTVAVVLAAYAAGLGILGPAMIGRARWTARAPLLAIVTYLAAGWSVIAA